MTFGMVKTLRGKREGVFSGRHMDSDQEETHVVSVMTQEHLETVAKVREEKDDRLLPHQIRRQRLTVKKTTKMENLTREVRFLPIQNIKNVMYNVAFSRVSELQV